MSHELFIGASAAATTIISVCALVGDERSLDLAATFGVISVAIWALLWMQRVPTVRDKGAPPSPDPQA